MMFSIIRKLPVVDNSDNNKYHSDDTSYYPYIYFKTLLRSELCDFYSLLRYGSWLSLTALPDDIVRVVVPTTLSPYL